jgi:uncharacterized BrkB/YihY/UPF0761 family membrane protein
MSQPEPLDYATVRPTSGAAIAALVVGLCSGPVGIAVALIGIDSSLDDSTKQSIALFGLVVCHAISLAFSLFVYSRLVHSDGLRGRKLAMGGVIATLGWAVTIVIIIFCLLSIGGA